MNQFYLQLSKEQRDSIYRNQKKQVGKYLAICSEASHLNPYMITLSPSINTLDATIELRKNFFKKLNNIKHKGFEVAYYSAVEIGLNKNNPSKSAQITEETRMKLMQKNFHIHIQIFTTMKKNDIKTIIKRMDHNLFYFSKITTPKLKGIKYDYVIKDIKIIDWKLQYILKTQFKGKVIYTSSRKLIADYLITKIWGYFETNYQHKWTKNIKDKYAFMLNLKKKGYLVLSSNNSINSIDMKIFDMIFIPNKNIYIYIKKNIL